MKRASIAIVGAGRAGSAMARQLADAGYAISEIICRENTRSLAVARRANRKIGAKVRTARRAHLNADAVWFLVPDSKIEEAASELLQPDWRNKIALHASGVRSSDALQVLREHGASVASVHPLMTFVSGSLPSVAGVTFAIEGDPAATRLAESIVRDLKGNVLRIRKQDKIAYHAFATMICPLLVSLLAAAEEVAELAGIGRSEARSRMMPIISQTLRNVEKLGPGGSFSGPIVRGDVETVRQHLAVLSKTPASKHAYAALARTALECLPSRNRRGMEELLQEHSAATLAVPARPLRSKPLTRKERKERP